MALHRDRASRRSAARRYCDALGKRVVNFQKAKQWKLLCFRSNKLRRAKQLGRIWPRSEWKKLMQDAEPIRLLFVCSRNQWRSPTGEAIFRRVDGVDARSAGTSKAARRKVTVDDVRWADLILVMEEKHSSRLRATFRQEITHKALHVLDIPDDYQFMDEELIELLSDKTHALIDVFEGR